MGVLCGVTSLQEAHGPGFKRSLLPEEEATCSLSLRGGGVKSPEAGAGVPAPPLIQVSASVLCKEQGGLSCVLGLRLGA